MAFFCGADRQKLANKKSPMAIAKLRKKLAREANIHVFSVKQKYGYDQVSCNEIKSKAGNCCCDREGQGEK
jgi:hypothetical protein